MARTDAEEASCGLKAFFGKRREKTEGKPLHGAPQSCRPRARKTCANPRKVREFFDYSRDNLSTV
jgi:hypothetical protein